MWTCGVKYALIVTSRNEMVKLLIMKCPGESGAIVTETQKGKATANVFWTVQVTDNSVREDPNAVIQVQSSHEPGQELPIGETSIKITATDQAGNSVSCYFSIDVRGK